MDSVPDSLRPNQDQHPQNMKTFYALSLSLLFALSTHAQECSHDLGPGLIPITQDTVLPNGSYWVCSGVTVEFSDFTFAWVESDCNVTISGGLGNYSFKPNCNVTLTSNAFNNIVVYDNSTTVVDNGSNTYPTVCTEVTYGYASAPVGGCDIAAGIDQTISADRPAYYPNPANGTLNISGAANKTVVIRDMTGRTVLHRSAAEGPVDISTVPPGTYFVTMPDGGKEVTGRVVVF